MKGHRVAQAEGLGTVARGAGKEQVRFTSQRVRPNGRRRTSRPSRACVCKSENTVLEFPGIDGRPAPAAVGSTCHHTTCILGFLVMVSFQ